MKVFIILLASSLLLFAGCKPIKVIPHIEGKGDTYCLYKITKVDNTGSGHALKIGDAVCLYCSGAANCALYGNRWIHVYLSSTDNEPLDQLILFTDTEISYYIEPDATSTSCTNCPGQNKFQLRRDQ
ncbi:MAG: hypothetical protein ACRDE8_02535 [Ginsengibacter sp.]